MSVKSAFDDLFHVLQALPTEVKKNSAGVITFPFTYRSRLKKWAGEQTQKSQSPVRASHLEEAKKAWLKCASSNDFTQLTQRNVRMLSSDGSFVRSEAFAEYLKLNTNLLTPRIVRTLVPTMHTEWGLNPKANQLISEATFNWIRQYSGKDKTLLLWKQHSHELFTATGPARIAAQVIQELEDTRTILETYRLKTGMSLFAVAANDYALGQLCTIVGRSEQPQQAKWQFLLDKFLRDGLLSRAAKENAIGNLILTLRSKEGSYWDQTKDDLKTYVLTSKEFGDPRINPERWTKMPPEVVETLVAWLSEEDIEFFFNLIITDDPHRRKDYWLRFIPHIKSSRVAISAIDESAHYLELQEWQRKGRDFAKVSGDASAFILDFGDYVVVEFSRVGNACFVFDKKTFGLAVGSFYRKSFALGSLKHPRYLYRQSHFSNWQTDLNNKLSSIGIRPAGKRR